MNQTEHETGRNRTITLALGILIPIFSFFISRIIIGPTKRGNWKIRLRQLKPLKRDMKNTQHRIKLLRQLEEQAVVKGDEAKGAKHNEEIKMLSYHLNSLEKQKEDISSAFTKQEQQQRAHKGRITFYVAFFVGILSLILGLFSPIKNISSGTILGGIITLIAGYSYSWKRFVFSDPYYWYQLPNVVIIFSLLFAIVVIIRIGYQQPKH